MIDRSYELIFYATALVLLSGLSCQNFEETKILHIVPYGYEGELTVMPVKDPLAPVNNRNEEGFLEIEYKSNGEGLLNVARRRFWSEEKVTWIKDNKELVDSVQFVNLGIRTDGVETIFLVVRKGKSEHEIRENLLAFRGGEERLLDDQWKSTGGVYQLGPKRVYEIKENARYWRGK